MKIFVGIPSRERNHLIGEQLDILNQVPELKVHYLFNDTKVEDSFLGVEHTVTNPGVKFQGAETNSYNAQHLANLWNVLLSLARLHQATHFMVLGSDVMPNDKCLEQILKAVKVYPNSCVGALVMVNELGVANFWHTDGKRGWIQHVRMTKPLTVEKFAGGLVVFPITEELKFIPHKQGEIVGTTEGLDCILIPTATCTNVRPRGIRWNIQ